MITFTDGGPATTVFCTRQSIILKGRLHLPARPAQRTPYTNVVRRCWHLLMQRRGAGDDRDAYWLQIMPPVLQLPELQYIAAIHFYRHTPIAFLHPVLSWAAVSVFRQLCLKPAVTISDSGSLPSIGRFPSFSMALPVQQYWLSLLPWNVRPTRVKY